MISQERFNEKMDALDAANPEPLRQLQFDKLCAALEQIKRSNDIMEARQIAENALR